MRRQPREHAITLSKATLVTSPIRTSVIKCARAVQDSRGSIMAIEANATAAASIEMNDQERDALDGNHPG